MVEDASTHGFPFAGGVHVLEMDVHNLREIFLNDLKRVHAAGGDVAGVGDVAEHALIETVEEDLVVFGGAEDGAGR